MKETKMYSIFKVYDYKGGELNSSINMNEDELVCELAELFIQKFEDEDYPDSENEISLSEMKLKDIEAVLKKIESSNDFYSTYAAGDGFAGEVYEHVNNKLVERKIKRFIPQIAKNIKENWD